MRGLWGAALMSLSLLVILNGCAQSGTGPGSDTLTIPLNLSPTPPSPPPPAPPARTFVYPERGQTPQQEEFDRGQCYSWAVQQSGFDPANPPVAPPPPPSQAPSQGGLFSGALGGSALGAVGGAIGGNAGEGAAIGAAVGGLFGLMRREHAVDQERQQQASYTAAQQSSLAQGRANYNRAFGTCMTGRGYSVS